VGLTKFIRKSKTSDFLFYLSKAIISAYLLLTSHVPKSYQAPRTKQKNITQGDVCRAVGFDCAQISNIEAGKDNPTFTTIEKIAQALGVSN